MVLATSYSLCLLMCFVFLNRKVHYVLSLPEEVHMMKYCVLSFIIKKYKWHLYLLILPLNYTRRADGFKTKCGQSCKT